MKIISYDTTYRVYKDNVKTSNKLPNKTFEVHFSPTTGFYLKKIDDPEDNKGKIYGDSEKKVEGLLNAYDHANRSLGVILSGAKGIGKTLFAKLLAKHAREQGLPVILVNEGFKGTGDFIDSIHQGAVFLFDEFEKNFNDLDVDEQDINTSSESQNSLLNLFDGLSDQKHLYVITVNDIYKLNEYYLNRPGRFMYSIRLGFPTDKETSEYLKDNLDKKYYDQIPEILKFSFKIPLNYDSLRAICFQVNLGTNFVDAVKDLNIISVEQPLYKVKLFFTNGYTYELHRVSINLFEPEIDILTDGVELHFSMDDADNTRLPITLKSDKLKFHAREGSAVYAHTHKGTSQSNIEKVEISPYTQEEINYSL